MINMPILDVNVCTDRKVNLLEAQASNRFQSLDDSAKALFVSLADHTQIIGGNFSKLTATVNELHDRAASSIRSESSHNELLHQETQRQLRATSHEIQGIRNMSLVQHAAACQEIRLIREQKEKHLAELTEEVCKLKEELRNVVKQMAQCMTKGTEREQKKLKETSNAKFILLAAKELILEKQKVSRSCDKFYLNGGLIIASEFPRRIRHWCEHDVCHINRLEIQSIPVAIDTNSFCRQSFQNGLACSCRPLIPFKISRVYSQLRSVKALLESGMIWRLLLQDETEWELLYKADSLEGNALQRTYIVKTKKKGT